MADGTCTATAKSGEPCKLLAEPGLETCKWHRDRTAVTALASEMGRRSQEARRLKKEAAAANSVPPEDLGSVDAIREFIERVTADGIAAGDASMLNAAARVARAAQDLLPLAQLEKENGELRAMLKELGALKVQG